MDRTIPLLPRLGLSGSSTSTGQAAPRGTSNAFASARRHGGSGSRRSAPSCPPRSLTGREREVAVLVAKGMTNREIAERLTLSVRTAESHVAGIRTKLGFRTRAQIAAWVTEHEMARVG
ncbi:MAG: helix-turn-helix transcriptional regulator [Chloroflexi bacterium]|nr:helix-turn-helix transcriptional regulator [Chloroflexota bacterium]